jgi:hypothetical protein
VGVAGFADVLGLGQHPRVCTVLVDGLGARLLAERGGHAPFLRRAAADQPDGVPTELRTAVPSTTATALTTLGTGCAPGQHGVIGYRAFEPGSTRVVNHLTWPADIDPVVWQPATTVFERVAADGVPATMVGPAAFEGSGLTRAALRGPAYVRAETVEQRVDAAVAALSASPRAMVNVYWGDIDKTGHARGWLSHEWASQLERIDAGLQDLRRRAPADALVVVTADHGMVDCPGPALFDVAGHPHLRTDVLATAGEPRLVQLRVAPARRTRWPTGGATCWGSGRGCSPVTRPSPPGGSAAAPQRADGARRRGPRRRARRSRRGRHRARRQGRAVDGGPARLPHRRRDGRPAAAAGPVTPRPRQARLRACADR